MGRNRSRSSKDLRREQPKRAAHDRILIVCEGSKTEPNYLREIRQAARISSMDLHVLHSSKGTEPKQVVESAEEEFLRTKAYEKVFAVFDRDDHLTYIPALDMAEARDKKWKNDENVAARFEAIASVQSFELWLLLHFEDIKAVRRQNIWLKLGRGLAECLARPVVDFMRRACGAASVDVRWFVA